MNATQQQDNAVLELAQDGFAPSLEIQLKAERVQEPASFQEQQAGAYRYGLSIQPVQPVSITLDGTTAVFTLYGPGGSSPGEASLGEAT